MHPDLLIADTLLYKKLGFSLENLQIEKESAAYAAAEFTLNNRSIKFRSGKTIPTKQGQFVTCWKRVNEGPISPYDATDSFDFLIINTRSKEQFGQFIFPKLLLCEKGIVTFNKKEGKRGFRIYPPWDKADNPQAKKAQAWQLHYFINCSKSGNIDLKRASNLLIETL